MKKILLIASIICLAVLVFTLLPAPSQAALVPCGQPDTNPDPKLFTDPEPETPENEACPCTFCHFFVMFNRVYDFIVLTIVPLVGLAMLIAAGIMFMVASGNPGMLDRAKKFILATIAGLFIIYASWIIIHTLFTVIQVEEWTGIAEGGFSITCHVPGNKPAPPNSDTESPEYKEWNKKYGYICHDVKKADGTPGTDCICDSRQGLPSEPSPTTGCSGSFTSKGETHTGDEWCNGVAGNNYHFCVGTEHQSFTCNAQGQCTNFSTENCSGGCTEWNCNQGGGCQDGMCRDIACNYEEPAGPWAGHPRLIDLRDCVVSDPTVQNQQIQEFVDSNIGQTINGITVTGAKCCRMCDESYLGLCDPQDCPTYTPGNPDCLCCHHAAGSDHYGCNCRSGGDYGTYSYAMDISTLNYTATPGDLDANANYQCDVATMIKNVCRGVAQTGIKTIIGSPEARALCPSFVDVGYESHRSHLHVAITCQ